MDTNKIDQVYSSMINAADSINAGKEISEEDASNLKEMKDIVKSSTVENDNDETLTPSIAIGTYNPTTGDISVSDSQKEDITKKISDKHFDLFTSSNNDIEIDINSLSKFFSTRELENITDMESISKLVKAKLNGEKIRFDDLPSSIKQTVLNIASQQSTVADGNNALNKASLNVIANMVFESLASDYKKHAITSFDIDSMLSGFNKDLENLQSDMSKEMGSMYLNTDETRKAELDAAIERCKAEGKTESIAKLEKMKSSIDDAYNLNEFAEFCKRVRIKNFDLTKPKRVFQSFNAKYEKHDNNINDISICPMILDRHLKEDTKSNLKVCLAFCKYCMNMSPDNIEEHTFMYYFIRNIITIDRINPKGLLYDSISEKEKSFYDGFLANIKKCIFNLNNRSSNL